MLDLTNTAHLQKIALLVHLGHNLDLALKHFLVGSSKCLANGFQGRLMDVMFYILEMQIFTSWKTALHFVEYAVMHFMQVMQILASECLVCVLHTLCWVKYTYTLGTSCPA
jgi:hypothetical protein